MIPQMSTRRIQVGPGNAPSSIETVDIDEAVRRVEAEIVAIRHHLHQFPELSNREFETAALVARHVRGLGLEVRERIAHTGVLAILRGGQPGPVIAVRADMDALPVTEDTPYPFRSTVRAVVDGQDVGVMHACGHDMHTAIALGVASVLAGIRDRVSGTVLFIFQPCEEGAPDGEQGGARLMLDEGVFDPLRPSAIFGLHTDGEMPVGTMGYTSGATNASSDNFRITLTGRSAHAAWPHVAVDPIVMAAQAVLALQTIRARNLSPYEPSVVSVTQIHGGVRNNISPDEVVLEGTVRLFDADLQDVVERRFHDILDGVSRIAGGSYTLEYIRKNPVNVNDPVLTERMLPSIRAVVGPDHVVPKQPWMAAEDFGWFAREVPALFLHLGTVKPGTTSGNNHTPTFMADDSAIPVGMRVMCRMVLDFLTNSGSAPVEGAQTGR
jgi:amidohydrolase